MISVVIPLYNAGATVERTLRSVLAQTFTDFEIVVVDDGSTDDGVAKVLGMEIPNLRLIRQENAGVSAARNRGIAEARGEFVALLDSDDEWHPEYLQTQFEMTRKYPECDVFATQFEYHMPNGDMVPAEVHKVAFTGEDGVMSNYFEVASCSQPPVWTCAVMARKEAFESVGGFPVGIKSGEDLLTWARLVERFKLAYSCNVLATFNATGYENKERPKREPQIPDVVGIELSTIEAPYIRLYRAHWHRMRANVYMRLRQRRKSLKECMLSLRLNPLNVKVWGMVVFNFVPSKFQPF